MGMAMKRDLIELIRINPSDVREVFTADDGLRPYLNKIKSQVDNFTTDMTTKTGRDEIRSFAAKLVRSKTFLDGLGKEEVAVLKAIPAKIDANRKIARDTLDKWAEEVRQPLTDWENAEKARVDKHAAAIVRIEEAGRATGIAQELRAALSFVESVVISPDECEEYEAEYVRARDRAAEQLSGAILAAEQREREQAELEQLRAEKAERDLAARQEAEKQAAKTREREAAERAVAAERASAAAREQRLRDEAAAAERRAEQAAQAKRDRIAAEQRKEEQEAEKRAANRRHRASVNNRAVAALISEAGISEDQAKAAVAAIAQGNVPGVSIFY